MALSERAKPQPVELPHEPRADGDPMGTPADDETVLWKGRPDPHVLARTAMHTRSLAVYFAVLVGVWVFSGNPNAAITFAVLGVIAIAILYSIAWFSARTTLYILTETRLIMRIGMAIETRINVPLRHVQAANLRARGSGHGDITLELGGERLLGYVLLWPHVRPWHLHRPQPMLRAVPDAAKVAEMLADSCAAIGEIERGKAGAATGDERPAPAAHAGSASFAASRRAPSPVRLEEATA